MKIFNMYDIDWVIGADLESCAKWYAEYASKPLDEVLNETIEESEEELKRMKYIDQEAGVTRSMEEQRLIEIEKGGEFPRFFASTEF